MVIDTKLATGIVGCLGHSWSENIFSDITVVIDGQEFHCHKFHLSACSELFRVLLGSNASLNYLTIKGIKPDIFDIILNSIYKGENKITADNMMDLWYAVNQLEIRFLLDEIENFIILNITEDNYLQIFDVARDLKSNQVLAAVCQTFILNWEEFRQDKRFLTLSFEELQIIIPNLETLSPDDLVDSILNWTNYDSTTTTLKNAIKYFPFPSKEFDTQEKFVEITLKNIVDLDTCDGFFHCEHQSGINRKELIGQLLKKVKFDLISQHGLKKLLCDEVVMDCKAARDLVRQVLASSLESSEAVAVIKETPTLIGSKEFGKIKTKDSDLVPIVLFFDGISQLTAFNFNTNKFYSLKLTFKKISDEASLVSHFVVENNLYIVINYNIKPWPCNVINKISMDRISEGINSYKANHREVLIGCDNFVYRFINHLKSVNIVRSKIGSQTWNEVAVFNKTGEISGVFCFQDTILVLVSEDFESKCVTHFFCFDTTARITSHVFKCHVPAGEFSTFVMGDNMFILYQNGELWEVVRSDSVEIVHREKIQDFNLNIMGVFVHDQSIFVFCDLQNARRPLPTICSLGALKYVQAFNVKKQGQFLHVPPSWLTDEI